jgi:hypothetical protein
VIFKTNTAGRDVPGRVLIPRAASEKPSFPASDGTDRDALDAHKGRRTRQVRRLGRWVPTAALLLDLLFLLETG